MWIETPSLPWYALGSQLLLFLLTFAAYRRDKCLEGMRPVRGPVLASLPLLPLLVLLVSVSHPRPVAGDRLVDFGRVVAQMLGGLYCVEHVGEITEAVVLCRDSYDKSQARYESDHPQLYPVAACCLYGQFRSCVKTRVDMICTSVAANITETAVDYFQAFLTSDCSQRRPLFPTPECQGLLFPQARTLLSPFLVAFITVTGLFLGLTALIAFSRRRRGQTLAPTLLSRGAGKSYALLSL